MKPSDKSPELQSALDAIASTTFGRTRSEAIAKNICVQCGRYAIPFLDAVSIREYTISGLCQRCQDSIFGGDEE